MNNKKNILIISESLVVGGTEKALVYFCNLIPKEEYNVTLMLLQKKGAFLQELPKHINIITPPFKKKMVASIGLNFLFKEKIKNRKYFTAFILLLGIFFYRFFYWSFVLKILLFKNEDLMYNLKYSCVFNFCGNNKSKLIDILSRNMYIYDKKYVVCHTHLNKKFIKNICKTFSKYDVVFTVSKVLKEELHRLLPKSKIEQIKFYIDSKELITKSQQLDGFKKNGEDVLLSVGRLDRTKGFDITIKACRILVDKGYNIKWYIVGDGIEKKNLISLIKENNIENRFFLLGSKENPYPFFKSCDIYVQSSLKEAYCLTLTEAKIFNKPIVTTVFSGTYEQIKDNETGIIVETTPESIAAGVQKLLDNKDLREKLSNNLKEENKKPRPDYFDELKKYL